MLSAPSFINNSTALVTLELWCIREGGGKYTSAGAKPGQSDAGGWEAERGDAHAAAG